jgi:hypothetical protein
LKVQAEVSMCWIKDYRPRRIATKPNIAHLALVLIEDDPSGWGVGTP